MKIDNLKYINELEKENLLLKEKLEFHELFMESSNSWETFRDKDGNIIYVSPDFEHITGYSRNDYLTNKIKISDFVHPDDRENYMNNFKAQINRQLVTNFVCRIVDINNSLKYVSVSSKPVYNRQNEYLGFRTSVVDITEQKISEAKLIENEMKYRLLAENISDVIWILNLSQHKFTYISPSVIHLTGFSVDEALQQTIDECLDYHSAESVKQKVSPTLTDFLKNPTIRKTDHNEIKQLCKNGNYIWVETITQYQLTENGEIEILGVSRNIEKRKHAEQALVESEQRVTSILNNITDIVWSIKMPELKLDYVSPSVEKIYGYSPKEFFDNPNLFQEIIHPDDKPLLNERFQFLLANNYAIFERRNIHRNGKVVWILDKSQLIYNDNNEIVKIEGIAHDITELKEREFLIHQQNSELSKLNADKDKFIRILAHDLRNPFNSLLGFSDLLLKNLRKYNIQKVEKQLKIIHQTSHQTYNLLEDLLLWTKSQSGKLPYEPKSIVFIELCNEIIEYFTTQAAAKGISLNCFEHKKTILSADLNMIKTILRNLISNAIKFTNHGGQIEISTEKNDEDVTIIVSDNGIGIQPEVLTTLFDISKIYTTEGTANESGSGLGLLLCKDFVEIHGGKIWVESEVDKGSDFKFTMPLFND